MKPSDLTDEHTVTGALSRFGRPIPVYDDGFGKLYIHRDSMGISGIVRAQSWEDAYSICEDEFFPESTDTLEKIVAEYNVTRRHAKIIRPADGGPEREATGADYAPKLTGKFVRWEIIETPAPEGEEVWSANALFQEAYGFRPNGPNDRDKLKHGIYAKDLNGDSLDILTDALAAELEINLQFE